MTTTTETLPTSPIPAPIQALRALFEEDLKDVSFPDVNRAVLDDAGAKVDAAAAEVARLEDELAAARRVLQDAQDALLAKAQRALAYARIFAEENAELSARLDAVNLPRAGRKPGRGDTLVPQPASDDVSTETAPRKRGRPPRARPAGMLFSEESSHAGLADGEGPVVADA